MKYWLLVDDSQQDPYLYERIVKIFPLNIKAIYIRQTSRRKKHKTEQILKNIASMHIATCYFKRSEKAIEHSEAIGII